MELLTSTVVIVTVCGSIIAAVTDITKSKVYNVLTLPLAISGLAFHGIVDGMQGLAGSFLGILLGLALLIIPFLMGGMGGGDVKLLAGIGAWVGAPGILYVFIAAALISGLCAIVLLLWERRSVADLAVRMLAMWRQLTTVGQQVTEESWVDQRVKQREPRRHVIPFGVMVALAVIVIFVYSAAL